MTNGKPFYATFTQPHEDKITLMVRAASSEDAWQKAQALESRVIAKLGWDPDRSGLQMVSPTRTPGETHWRNRRAGIIGEQPPAFSKGAA